MGRDFRAVNRALLLDLRLDIDEALGALQTFNRECNVADLIAEFDSGLHSAFCLLGDLLEQCRIFWQGDQNVIQSSPEGVDDILGKLPRPNLSTHNGCIQAGEKQVRVKFLRLFHTNPQDMALTIAVVPIR